MKNVAFVAVAAVLGGLIGVLVFGQSSLQNGDGRRGAEMMISSDAQAASPKASTALEEMQAFEAMHSKKK